MIVAAVGIFLNIIGMVAFCGHGFVAAGQRGAVVMNGEWGGGVRACVCMCVFWSPSLTGAQTHVLFVCFCGTHAAVDSAAIRMVGTDTAMAAAAVVMGTAMAGMATRRL